MPAKSLDPLKKVTIDLFSTDVTYLHSSVDNFSETIRNLVRNHVICLKAAAERQRLGDLTNAR